MFKRIRDAMPLIAVVALLVIFNLMAAGCAEKQLSPDNEVRLYKALKASATAYNSAREALRKWDATHPFTDEEKAEIEKYAEDYRLERKKTVLFTLLVTDPDGREPDGGLIEEMMIVGAKALL